MKRIIQGALLTGTLVLGGGALAQQKATSPGSKGGTAEYRGFMIPTDHKAYLERLHHANQEEIKEGQLAQQNSTNPDVKAFGEQMVREHTQADQKVMTLAQSMGLKLADTPTPLNDVERKAMAAERANMEKLQSLKGDPFDSCYLSNQVGEHDAVLGKLMAGRQALGGNAQLTSLIDDLTQHVSQHRQHAYSILGKLGPSAMGIGGAGSGMGSTNSMGSEGAGTTDMGSSPGSTNNMGSQGAGTTGSSSGKQQKR